MMTNLRVPIAALLLVAAAATGARAQDDAPIQDNSFLIEEAYNQERGVVQHISVFNRPEGGDAWEYGFTQEWPFFGQRHQLSYTIPLLRVGDETGIGDVMLNYRNQLVGDGDAPLAVAPRLSVILPTGDDDQGLGSGAAAVEAALPVSFVMSPNRLVAHTNAGVTYTPSAKGPAGAEAATASVFLGQSVVWLAHPRLNFLVEAIWSRDQEVVGDDDTESGESFFVSPGVRAAFNLPGGLQIVPGAAVPIGVGPSEGETSLLLYLSLEHPFTRAAREEARR